MTPQDVVLRFNHDVIAGRDRAAFDEIMAPDFVNRTAAPGMSPGADGIWATFSQVLWPAFPDLTVEIHDQIREGDKVVTRKSFHGTLSAPLMGRAPTGRATQIDVIDIVRVANGQYAEHWGQNSLPALLMALDRDAA
ncbi:ester cyclase [Pseudooceanicola sp. C21-150M6]|uniref:ester cyclase n=1 Tax=Pseudooceanicola sp. C21-150M6 TaxID=3434355 RepID=UPI003D7FF067